jgi:N12 class adenine-specific DNA methylase
MNFYWTGSPSAVLCSGHTSALASLEFDSTDLEKTLDATIIQIPQEYIQGKTK